MEITASLVKELRERSGAGMMECKKALTENGGNVDAAMEFLRKTGLAKADKKAGRIAAEGRIMVAQEGGRAVSPSAARTSRSVAWSASTPARRSALMCMAAGSACWST